MAVSVYRSEVLTASLARSCIYSVYMALIISPKVRAKLAAKVPPVTLDEIEQCFRNRAGIFLLDTRSDCLRPEPD